MRHNLPLAYPGMRIGLFGGSFDPAHEGHRHVAETALKRLDLDRVWWLVAPQNPLKAKSSPFEARLKSAQQQALGPAMVVTDLEQRLSAGYTFQTLRALKRRCPGVNFVWIMGSDNLASFHHWQRWQDIAALVPIDGLPRQKGLIEWLGSGKGLWGPIGQRRLRRLRDEWSR